jgi:predicted nucleotidyltransferase
MNPASPTNPTNKLFPFPSRWHKCLQDNAKSQEAERVRILNAVNEALNTLTAKYKWEKIYLVGSVIRSGGFKVNSDVDIAVKGLDKYQLYSFIGDISLLLKRDVDVIRLEETPFAAAIINKGIPWTPKIN